MLPVDTNWTFNENDSRILESIINFMPQKVVDMHAHLWNAENLNLTPPDLFLEGPGTVTVNVWRGYMEQVFGKSTIAGGLMLGVPTEKCDIKQVNEFICWQVKSRISELNCKGSVLVSVKDPESETLSYLDQPGIAGIKPYHSLCTDYPTFQAHLSSYLPEWAWQAADERKLIITIHLVRELALSDKENQKELVEKCRKYPNAKIVLAHAARGFNPANTINGLSALNGIKNIWFDMSAICESAAIVAILREFGSGRLIWGSDFPVSHIRGKCVSVGDGFAWLQCDTVNWEKLSPRCNPTIVAVESIKALKEAADLLKLEKSELENIFYYNGLEMLTPTS